MTTLLTEQYANLQADIDIVMAEDALMHATSLEQEDLIVPVQRAYEGWHTIPPEDYAVITRLVKRYGFRSLLSMLAHMARMRSADVSDLADMVRERGYEDRAVDIGGYVREWDRLATNLEMMRTPRIYSIPDMEKIDDPKAFVLDTIYEIKEKTPFE